MVHSALYIDKSSDKGKGVFTQENIPAKTLLEISPVIVMSKGERILLDQTLLHDYIFEWGANKDLCCMALGYVAMYNHSYTSNCEYEMDFEKAVILIKSIRFINAREELFINYNGNWNDPSPVWFHKK